MEQIPKIRFSQFDNKWNSILIGNLAKIKRGASPRPIQNPKWFDENSDIGWLRISDVTEQNGRIKYLEQKISKLGQEKTRVLNTPHLLLSIAATVGKPVVNYVKTGVHDGFLIFENPKFDREFMFQWFDMFRPKWNKYGQPGSQVNLNSDIIRNHKMMIPSLPEQFAIGSLFRTLDDLLASYKDNLANYQSLKATMLSKMFPKAGQTVPEIRLDGFEGEWDLLEINDLADDFQSGGTPKTNVQEYWDGDIPWIQSSDLETNCLFEIKVQKSISEKGLKNSSAKIIPKDSIAVVTRVGVGKLAVMRHEYATSQDFLSLSNLKSNIEFTAYLLYRLLQKEVTQLQGTSIKGITKVELLSKKVLIPSLSEQQAIGSYFSNLDNLIATHQEKISQLETLKKKLLQDMFI